MNLELPVPRGQNGPPVLRDLPVLPVPSEVRERLEVLERLERMVLVVLMEIQVQREIPQELILKEPRAIVETPALLVLLDRGELLNLLELLGPRVTRQRNRPNYDNAKRRYL